MMNAHRLSISIRPYVFEKISAKAKARQVSISRQIEDIAERYFDELEETDYIITREELDRRSKKLDEDIVSGKAKVFSDSKSLIHYLHEAASKFND